MMKRTIKVISGFLTLCLLLGTVPVTVSAQGAQVPKEEVVYVALNADGTTKNTYVVNSFDMTEPGHITDYGPYDKVTNLSTTDSITLRDDTVELDAPKGRFYYQGDLDSVELPWLITVTYLLDGKAVAAKDLAGAEGHLEIRLSIRDNEKVDPVFVKNYALQITLTLDTGRCASISAEGATLANSGKDKAVSFIKLPDKAADYSVTADVSDFEMDGIQISGIPLSVDFDLPDTDALTGGLTDLSGGISSLDSGAQEMSKGADGLRDGTEKLHKGLQDMQTGMNDLRDGFDQLVGGNAELEDGSQKILNALKEIQENLEGFSVTTADLDRLVQGSAGILNGISDLSEGLAALKNAFVQADTGIRTQSGGTYSSLRQANEATIATLNEQIELLRADPAANAAQIQQLTQVVNLLLADNELLTNLKTGISGNGTAANPGLAAGAATLKEQYAQFDASIQALPAMLADMAGGITKLKDGLSQLASNYVKFHAGVVGYADGAASIFDGYKKLCAGFSDLVAGSGELSSGAGALYQGTKQLSDGTSELESRTENMDSDVDEQIEELLAPYMQNDFQAVSFVSARNTSVKSVQFVMLTQLIEKEEAKNESKPAASDANPGLWQRLLALFGM